MSFFSRFLTAWQAASSEQPVSATIPERPGCEAAECDDYRSLLSEEERMSAVVQGLSGKCGRYLMERADAEISAREFAEQYGSGY